MSKTSLQTEASTVEVYKHTQIPTTTTTAEDIFDKDNFFIGAVFDISSQKQQPTNPHNHQQDKHQ